MFLKNLIDISDPSLADMDIKGISYDTREVKPGYIFVARKGERIDSHNLLKEAHKRGAVFFVLTEDIQIPYPKIVVSDSRKFLGIISHRFYGEPSKKIKVIGVTGTNGKTTTTTLLHSIYETSGIPCGLIGTIEYKIKFSMPAVRTTPESLDIAKMMHDMLQEGIKNTVMEVSSHGVAQHRIQGIDFDVAALTGIGRDHLDFHHTMESYIKTKLSLFENLKNDALAFIPEGKYFELFSSHTKARVISLLGSNSDYSAEVLNEGWDGMEIMIHTKDGKKKIKTRISGRHNIPNIVIAYAIANEDGIPYEKIRMGLWNIHPIPGRFEKIGNVIVDFAHTPSAMETVLKSARSLVEGKIITVFGCGGDRDRGKRALMGESATRLSDYVIITSDNPRREDPLSIIKDIEKGIDAHFRGKYEVVVNREEAIKKAIKMAEKRDMVLVLGKGHEEYQIIGDRRIPFNDREVVRNCLSAKNLSQRRKVAKK